MNKKKIIILVVLGIVFFSATNIFFMMVSQEERPQQVVEKQGMVEPLTPVKSNAVSGDLTRRAALHHIWVQQAPGGML